MKAETKTVLLGNLGLAESFTFPHCKTVYKTIDHRPTPDCHGAENCSAEMLG
jgi:hypothetical protein